MSYKICLHGADKCQGILDSFDSLWNNSVNKYLHECVRWLWSFRVFLVHLLTILAILFCCWDKTPQPKAKRTFAWFTVPEGESIMAGESLWQVTGARSWEFTSSAANIEQKAELDVAKTKHSQGCPLVTYFLSQGCASPNVINRKSSIQIHKSMDHSSHPPQLRCKKND